MREKENERISGLLKKCHRNRWKPDLHSFKVSIENGFAWVEAFDDGIHVLSEDMLGNRTSFVGSVSEATDLLCALKADISTVEM